MSNVIIDPTHQSVPRKPKEKWDKTDPRQDPQRKKAEAYSKRWWKENESKLTPAERTEVLRRYNNNKNDLPGLVPLGSKRGRNRSTFSHIPEEKWNKIFKENV